MCPRWSGTGAGVTVSGVPTITFRLSGQATPQSVKLTAEERDHVVRAASEAGLGVSAWARVVLGDAMPEGGAAMAREALLAAATGAKREIETLCSEARARHRALVRGSRA